MLLKKSWKNPETYPYPSWKSITVSTKNIKQHNIDNNKKFSLSSKPAYYNDFAITEINYKYLKTESCAL